MNPAQIECILGKPNKTKIDSHDPNRLILEFNEQNLRLTIYQHEQSKLGYISSSHQDLRYQGKKIIGQTIDFIENEVFNQIVKKWEVDK